jgi:hypothetical protein
MAGNEIQNGCHIHHLEHVTRSKSIGVFLCLIYTLHILCTMDMLLAMCTYHVDHEFTIIRKMALFFLTAN